MAERKSASDRRPAEPKPEQEQSGAAAKDAVAKKQAARGDQSEAGIKAKAAPAGKPPDPDEKIEEPGAQVNVLEDRYLRLRAEYENHIRRTSQEKSELIIYAGTHVFRMMLPILDDLRRTVEHAREKGSGTDNPVVQGVELIIEKFVKLLEAEGVERFDSVGEKFDPELHEALMTRASDENAEGIVLEEFEAGYKYRDKVLRHARVVVGG